jgi:hypothetical protein
VSAAEGEDKINKGEEIKNDQIKLQLYCIQMGESLGEIK